MDLKLSLTRRKWLEGAAAAVAAVGSSPFQVIAAAKWTNAGVDVSQAPSIVRAFTGNADQTAHGLVRSGDSWSGDGVDLAYNAGTITVHAPSVALRRVHLRWRGTFHPRSLILGDAWERSYGDLAWLPMQAERPLPWYCMVHEQASTRGFGVKTGASAFAFWQVDSEGLSLWLDLRNGGNGVLLGDRLLRAATVVAYESKPGESAFQATRMLCRKMAADVVLPKQRGSHSLKSIYGSNDWYYAYGQNTADGLLRDADLVRELSPAAGVRPFAVVDDGYQDRTRFPSMHRLAESIRSRDVAPGVWVRPLRAPKGTAASWLLPAARFGSYPGRAVELAFDPTVAEARTGALDVLREAAAWGYDMIKHDFTTYELLGAWGNEMGASPTSDGWNFQDRSKTNSEIITDLYKDIRTAAGDERIVLGCNTIGHLSAGIFDASRTGDDVSGHDWERTRRMGINTLAMRLPQNGIFFSADADCVPITRNIPWNLTEQWLRAVAASGTVLLISPEPGAIGPEQKKALSVAFAECAVARGASEPLDFVDTRTPEVWIGAHYDWTSAEGASPFNI
jgi:alpha-galactosidase